MFFLLRRRPPASTLFPTRRSSDLAVAFAPRRRAACERERDAARPRRRCSSRAHLGGRGGLVLAPLAADRKSTRLNSSHSSISYAVFCLKKKNISSALPPPLFQPAD